MRWYPHILSGVLTLCALGILAGCSGSSVGSKNILADWDPWGSSSNQPSDTAEKPTQTQQVADTGEATRARQRQRASLSALSAADKGVIWQKAATTSEGRKLRRAGVTLSQYVDDGMKAWLEEPLPVRAVGTLPSQPKAPDLPELVKGEFETTKSFKARVAREQLAYEAQARKIRRAYARAVAQYNDDVSRYNQEVAAATALRQKAIPIKRNQLISEAMGLLYGEPVLSDLQYNADTGQFTAKLSADAGEATFSEYIAIKVPIDEAPSFKKKSKSVSPRVYIDVNASGLRVARVDIPYQRKQFVGVPSAQQAGERVSVRLKEYGRQSLSTDVPLFVPTDTNIADRGDATYFTNALELENDPEIARELQKQAALKQQQQNEQKKRETERYRARVRSENRALEAALRGSTQADPELSVAVSNIRQRQSNPNNYLFAVGIEDYRYAPDIANVDNSLSAVVDTISRRFGVSDDHRVVIHDEDATAGFIRAELVTLLGRLGPDDRLYFYYAGHGIPGTQNPDRLFLAPSDTQVKAYEDDSFAMDKILKRIDSSAVGEVIAFMDTCFSGKSDVDDYIFEGIAAVTAGRRDELQSLPSKVTMFYAAQGDEYSNNYGEKGHRLFSYYLAKGLAEGISNTRDLNNYISKNVSKISRKKGRTYKQTPYYKGHNVSWN